MVSSSRREFAASLALGTAAVAVITAAVAVPLALSKHTVYVNDVKWPIVGTCALIAGLAVLAGWAAGARLPRDIRVMARALGLFLGAVLLSLALSHYQAAAFRETAWYVIYGVLFVATAAAFRRPGWATALVAAIIVTGTIVSLVGCLQAYGVDVTEMGWSKGGAKVKMVGEEGRVMATIGLETIVGGYTAAVACLCLGLILFLPSTLLRAALVVPAVLAVGCMVFSGTRAAWFGCFVGVALLVVPLGFRTAVWAWKRPRGKGVFALAAALAAALITLSICFHPFLREHVEVIRKIEKRVRAVGEHFGTRETIWKAGVGMFLARPVLGGGPGTFRIYFPEFRPLDYASHQVMPNTLHAHSEYLEVLTDTGMVGMTAFLILLGLLSVGSWRAVGRPSGQTNQAMLAAAAAAVVALLVHALVSVDTRYPTCQMMLWMLMGLTVALWRPAGAEREFVILPRRPGLRVAAVLLAAAAAFALWKEDVIDAYLARIEVRSATNAQGVGRWEQSSEFAARAIELDPTSVLAYYALGNSLFYAGLYEPAYQAFKSLQRHSPDFADVHLRLAALDALLGRMPEARAEARLAARFGVAGGGFGRADSLSDEQLRSLAFQLQIGEIVGYANYWSARPEYYGIADQMLSRLRDRYPERPEVLIALAQVRLAADDMKQGAELLTRAGEVAQRHHDLALATSSFARAAEVAPDYAEPRVALAGIYAAAERWADVLPLCRRLVVLQPRNVQYHLMYAHALYQLDRVAEARAQCEAVLQLEPENAAAKDFLQDTASPP